jgi:hypothetical protein
MLHCRKPLTEAWLMRCEGVCRTDFLGWRMRIALVVAGIVAVGSATAGSSEAQLEGDSLRKAVSGKTVSLATPMGGLPISYRPDGTMQGRAGALATYTGTARDSGRWWVVADQLCQRWNNWLGGTSYCFKLRQQGASVHWTRDDGVSGMATIAGN